jgi:hypothetical protein
VSALCALLLSGCGLITSGVTDLKVLDIAVDPPSGQGPFTAAVELSPHTKPGAYMCWVVASGAPLTSGTEIMQMRFPPDSRYAEEVIVFTPSTPGLQQVLCTDADVDLMTPRTGTGHEIRSNEFTVPYRAQGTRLMYDSSGQQSCDVDTAVLITVMPGNAAQLNSQGPDIIDHINCTTGQSNEAWLVAGRAESATGPISFATCNDGRFQADGQFTLTAGRPFGQVTCSKDGVRQVTIEVR